MGGRSARRAGGSSSGGCLRSRTARSASNGSGIATRSGGACECRKRRAAATAIRADSPAVGSVVTPTWSGVGAPESGRDGTWSGSGDGAPVGGAAARRIDAGSAGSDSQATGGRSAPARARAAYRPSPGRARGDRCTSAGGSHHGGGAGTSTSAAGATGLPRSGGRGTKGGASRRAASRAVAPRSGAAAGGLGAGAPPTAALARQSPTHASPRSLGLRLVRVTACPPWSGYFSTWTISLAGVPSGGRMSLFVSSFSNCSSRMVRLVWKTVSSVTGKRATSVPARSAP